MDGSWTKWVNESKSKMLPVFDKHKKDVGDGKIEDELLGYAPNENDAKALVHWAMNKSGMSPKPSRMVKDTHPKHGGGFFIHPESKSWYKPQKLGKRLTGKAWAKRKYELEAPAREEKARLKKAWAKPIKEAAVNEVSVREKKRGEIIDRYFNHPKRQVSYKKLDGEIAKWHAPHKVQHVSYNHDDNGIAITAHSKKATTTSIIKYDTGNVSHHDSKDYFARADARIPWKRLITNWRGRLREDVEVAVEGHTEDELRDAGVYHELEWERLSRKGNRSGLNKKEARKLTQHNRLLSKFDAGKFDKTDPKARPSIKKDKQEVYALKKWWLREDVEVALEDHIEDDFAAWEKRNAGKYHLQIDSNDDGSDTQKIGHYRGLNKAKARAEKHHGSPLKWEQDGDGKYAYHKALHKNGKQTYVAFQL